MKFKQRLTSISVAAALAASTSMVALDAYAMGNSGGNGNGNGGGKAPGKFLLGWASDQMLDGNNCSPLDDVLGLRGLNPGGAMDPNAPHTPSSPADCAGLLPDADFVVVIDADPKSKTYGQVVNTADMPGVYGAHLLDATENFVDNALDLAIANAGDPNHLGNPNGTADDDILGGVPNKFFPNAGPLGVLPEIVPAPSSVLNEAHHHSVFPTVDEGNVYSYYGGIISANIFGCDITDPMLITPTPASTRENLPLHADPEVNVCGLTVNGAETNDFTGTDDLEFNPTTGSYFTTMMGAGGNPVGNFSGTGTVKLSLPPVLTTPGGLLEITSIDEDLFQYSAIPDMRKYGATYASVYGHGTFTAGGPQEHCDYSTNPASDANGGTCLDVQRFYEGAAPGAMLGPERYAPRVESVNAGVNGNGECVAAVGPTAIADPATGGATNINAFNLCVPGVAPFNQLGGYFGAVNLSKGINEGPDTGTLPHPHGIGIREDLNGVIADSNGVVIGSTTGIIMTSDYADPVSLALNGSGLVGANGHNLGTTIRLWDLARPENGPYQVIQMPDGHRHEDRATMEEPEGLMAMRTTHGTNGSKGAFVASMCGGSIFYSSDITTSQPVFKNVYDFGTCVGASVFTLTQDDEFMFLPIAGLQVFGDPTHDRDYQGEHDRRIAVLDLRNLMAAGDDYQCDGTPEFAWANVPQIIADLIPELNSPLGQGITLGAGFFPYNQSGDLNHGGNYWPNNSASDCPLLVDRVDFSGDGDDGVFGTADDHPDNETSRGGPHFTTHDRDDDYVATSNYFVDLREFAIKDVGLLLEALGLGQAWCDKEISDTDNGHAAPPGGARDADDGAPGGTPEAGLGFVFNALGIPGVPGALVPADQNLSCHTSGAANILPGTGSIGDDTVCMMKWNRNKSDLALDSKFNKNDANSPTGCIDMDFGDTGSQWVGARNPGAGNATVHGMSFYNTDGELRFFSNGTID